MKRVLIIIILTIVLIILVIAGLAWKGHQFRKEEASVATYKIEYQEGENPKIKIENKSAERICFSSCYPYYLEENNGNGFASYDYSSCPESDVVEKCIEPGEIKAFELLLDRMEIKKGPHRVAVPACIGCALQQNFRQDKFLYSNEFIIK